jgi:hypothetical protein
MASSKNDLLKELLPGLNDLFMYGEEGARLIHQVKDNDALKKKEQDESNIKVSANYSG